MRRCAAFKRCISLASAWDGLISAAGLDRFQRDANEEEKNYSPADIGFIAPRVLELVYTAYDLRPFAEDMGYHGEPFRWDEVRRAQLRAELDACYARLYGLTRDELRYILDPKEVYGEDPSTGSGQVSLARHSV